MNNLLRKIARVGFAAFAFAATSIAPATAAVWNSHDCKYYGVCAPWDLQYPSYSNSSGGASTSYPVGGQVFLSSHAARTEEAQG